MDDRFKYAPGKPGFGTKGDTGIDGNQGLSMYFTDFEPTTQVSLINSRIVNNQTLWSSIVEPLPGGRVYVSGDLFFDSEGRTYEINAELGSFTYKFASINMGGYFVPLRISSSTGYARYFNSNISPKYLIDSVYTQAGAINYTNAPTNIYGIQPINFSRIEYSNVKPGGIYNTFTLFSSATTGNDHKAIALVYDEASSTFRLGNLDSSNGNIRNVSLSLDVSVLIHTKQIGYSTFNENTPTGAVLTNYEINANSLFDPVFVSSPATFITTLGATDCSIRWKLSDFASGVSGDLYFYENIKPSGQTYTVDSSALRPMIFTNLAAQGYVKITGLSMDKKYACYMKLYKDGWARTSSIKQLFTGAISVLPKTYVMDTSSGLSNFKLFDVSTNMEWGVSITSNPENFVSISQCSSISGLDGSIFVNITPNVSTNGRMAKIRVYLADQQYVYEDVSIWQPRGTIGPELFLSSSISGFTTTWPLYTFDASYNGTVGGSYSVTVDLSVNRSWYATLPAGVTMTPNSGSASTSFIPLTISISPNNQSVTNRNLNIVFNYSGTPVTLRVVQKGVNFSIVPYNSEYRYTSNGVACNPAFNQINMTFENDEPIKWELVSKEFPSPVFWELIPTKSTGSTFVDVLPYPGTDSAVGLVDVSINGEILDDWAIIMNRLAVGQTC